MAGKDSLDDGDFAQKPNDKAKTPVPGATQRSGDTRGPAPLANSGDTRK